MNYLLELQIIKAVGRLQRDLQTTDDLGVFPWQVSSRLDIYRCEQSLRKDMMKLVNSGKLIRIGGEDCRRGYKLAPPKRREPRILSLHERFNLQKVA